MCEWCERLAFRNYKWDHHADWRGMYFIFKYTGHGRWTREWSIRKDWRRAENWIENNTNLLKTSPYYGLGGRYWSSYD